MMEKHLFHAMGTEVSLAVIDDRTSSYIQGQLLLVEEQIRNLERYLSRFDSKSDISRINMRTGQWVSVHQDTIEVLTLAKDYFLLSGGWFDPCLGETMDWIGYDTSFEQVTTRNETQLGSMPTRPSTMEFPYYCNASGGCVWLAPGYKLDLGGIAKGWIVEQAAKLMKEFGFSNFVCDAGGDMVCSGKNHDRPWMIGIEDPFRIDQQINVVEVESLCVATSGTYKRCWNIFRIDKGVFGQESMHHLVNPFTGRPTVQDIVSCTVIGKSLVHSEILAKVCLLKGSQKGLQWLAKQKNVGFIVVLQTGKIIDSFQ